jgi:ornithine decarboxylase
MSVNNCIYQSALAPDKNQDYKLSHKLLDFLSSNNLETPFLVMDIDAIAKNYVTLRRLLPQTDVYYAIKANPAPEILKLLVQLGSNFDTASIYEIKQCIAAGAQPERISYGNTIKKARDIVDAYNLGVKLFAFDSLWELEKIATHAPGVHVYCRILTENEGAEWPLSKKFGCTTDMACDLLLHSRRLGLEPYGISFHVGSQQTNPLQWDRAISTTAMLFQTLSHLGIKLKMVNLGGGFPAKYKSKNLNLEVYTSAIMSSMERHFGNQMPSMMIEPGRSLVADAGLIQTEIVLISRKSYQEDKRWVFLDIGKFGGLIETMDECIKYRIRTPWDNGQVGTAIIAGPTCDSADVLYENTTYELPLDLSVGDKIEILSAGAYTTTYASVGFNGFLPLKTYCI